MASKFPPLILIILIFSLKSHSHVTENGCVETERRALLSFKKNVVAFNNHSALANWVGGDCCSWTGITCSDITGNVIELDLDYKLSYDVALDGNVLSPLLSLHHLAFLDISGSNFTGSQIPKFLGSYPSLQILHLLNAGFVGRVPSELGNLSTLNELLIGDIVPTINELYIGHDILNPAFRHEGLYIENTGWLSQLKSLQSLSMVSMNLTLASGLFRALSTLSNISEIHITYCQFGSFPLPPLSHVNFTSLTTLDLSQNNIHQRLPEWLPNLKNLRFLDLSYNSFYGPLSIAISNLSSLEHLQLSYNNFNDTLQETQFPNKLEYIYLGDNLLYGSLPATMGNLSSLRQLTLPHNNLRGTLSDAHFNNMSKLNDLDLSYNPSLSFEIPDNWIPSFQLQSLHLDFCQVGPEFPSWLETQHSLDRVSLSNAGIKGLIPHWFVNSSSIMMYIDLSNNLLSGHIIKEFGEKPMKYLNTLDLSNNSFQGDIPRTICSLSSLQELYLSENILTGDLPHCLTNLTLMKALDLGYNKLTGHIPPLNSIFLWILSLTSNSLTGVIPNISDSTRLQILDLSNNYLSGHIPPSLGNLAALSVHNPLPPLSLSRFGIHSPRINSIWLTTKAKKKEYGPEILEMINVLDLSNNALSGYIPDELMQLHGLQALNLSGNHLTGRIPTNIDQLQLLESLDLSRNNLSGTIPSSMGKLNFLEDLNLSYNNLSGRIPANGQLQSFDNSSIYEGNPFLCGFPIGKKCLGDGETNQPGFNNKDEVHKDRDEDFFWFYLAIAPGFVVGFWLVWGTLIFAKRWRIAYFQAIDRFYYIFLERM